MTKIIIYFVCLQDAATQEFATASPIRTVIAADFDNTGTLQVFMNNIVYRGSAENKLFRILPEGASVGIVREDIGDALEPVQHGTGRDLEPFLVKVSRIIPFYFLIKLCSLFPHKYVN